MKKESHMDKMHESHGMKHHLKMEHERHGHRIHHEHAMHKGSSPYKHETEEPHIPPKGMNEPMTDADDFKSDSMDTAYGQAGKHGCMSDQKKIHSQFKSYGWDANTGY